MALHTASLSSVSPGAKVFKPAAITRKERTYRAELMWHFPPAPENVLSLGSVRNRVEAVLRDVIQPLFQADGGSIELVAVHDGVVQVRLGGAYRGCPSTSYTVEGVLVPALRRATGEDVRVEVVV